jgi:hypothetical protein
VPLGILYREERNLTDEVQTAPVPTTPTFVAVAKADTVGAVQSAEAAVTGEFDTAKAVIAADFAKAHAVVVKFGLGIGGLIAGWILAKIF